MRNSGWWAGLFVVVIGLGTSACPTPIVDTPDAGGPGEGEGEGGVAGEGEGEGGEGEGEGGAAGEGEGEGGAGEGEGEGTGAAPEDPGPFTTSSSDATVSSANGDVALTIVVPNGAANAPVVVIHPGFTLGKDLYASYADQLASRGVVAVLADPPDALFGGPTHAELAQDLALVLDFIVEQAAAGGQLAGKVDVSRIGLSGHSMGGKISLLLGTTDARVKAIFAIDPVDAAGGPLSSPGPDFPSVTPELMGDLHIPLVLLGETTNATCSGAFCQACAPADDNFQQYYDHVVDAPALEIEVVGANHMSFLDNPDCGFTCSACSPGTDDPTESRRLTRRYMTAFFEKVLLGDNGAGAFLTGAAMTTDVNAGRVQSTSKNGF